MRKPTRHLSVLFLLGAGLMFLGNMWPASATNAASTSTSRAGARSMTVANLRTTTVSLSYVFDYRIPVAEVQSDERAQGIDYVWGATRPEPAGGQAWHDFYVAWAQGYCPGVGVYGPCPKGGPPSASWLKKYHPDWILWQTGKNGKPTRPARSSSNPGPIVDFTNPAVQQYWVDNFIGPALKSGYDGVAWDNPVVENPYHAVGHFDRDHHFVRQFSGVYTRTAVDTKWAQAQSKAFGEILGRVRALYPRAQFSLNASMDCLYVPSKLWALPLRYVRTLADEQGYTFWGGRQTWVPAVHSPHCRNRWLAKTQAFIAFEKGGGRLVLENEVPLKLTKYMTDGNKRARSLIQWALANYLLVKYSRTYFWFGGVQRYGYPVVPQREESADLGQPLGDMRQSQGVYVRYYTKGLAIVNPSLFVAFKFALPAGRYRNLYGQNVNKAHLGPHSGMVLVARH